MALTATHPADDAGVVAVHIHATCTDEPYGQCRAVVVVPVDEADAMGIATSREATPIMNSTIGSLAITRQLVLDDLRGFPRLTADTFDKVVAFGRVEYDNDQLD